MQKKANCENSESEKNVKSHLSQARAVPDSTLFVQRDLIVECPKTDTEQVRNLPSSTYMSKLCGNTTNTVNHVLNSTSAHWSVPQEINTVVKPTGIKKNRSQKFQY